MLTFGPGPSQLTADTVDAIREIAVSGFLSSSHRGQWFKDVCKTAVEGLRCAFAIPDDYHLLFQPSATAAMELLLRNFVSTRSFHFVHGAFSQRFFETATEMRIQALSFVGDPKCAIDWRNASVPEDVDTLCVTHNETSTGLAWPQAELADLRKAFPDRLLVVDATSSWGGTDHDWRVADAWFASVQKCLGMPAGLGVVTLSPKALEVATATEVAVPWNPVGWQRIPQLVDKMSQWQTPETPNMLAIALLARQMERWDHARVVSQTEEKARFIYRPTELWQPFVIDPAWRSKTVAHFLSDRADEIRGKAQRAGYQLGSGYGAYKKNGIRLANFPALDLDSFACLYRALGA